MGTTSHLLQIEQTRTPVLRLQPPFALSLLSQHKTGTTSANWISHKLFFNLIFSLTNSNYLSFHRPIYALDPITSGNCNEQSMATQAWQSTLTNYLLATGWKSVCSENVYFVKTDGTAQLRCVIHVDDILFSSSDRHAAQSFINNILQRFKGQQEPTDRYVGLQIETTHDSINLHQTDFIHQILERFGMTDCNPVYTPLETGTHLSKNRLSRYH